MICVTCQAVEALSYDEEMCARIIHTQLHVDMLSNLRCDSLTSTTLSDCQTQFIDTLLRTLLSVVRNSAAGRSSLSPCLDVVHKFCTLTAYPVSFFLLYCGTLTALHSANKIQERTSHLNHNVCKRSHCMSLTVAVRNALCYDSSVCLSVRQSVRHALSKPLCKPSNTFRLVAMDLLWLTNDKHCLEIRTRSASSGI